MNRRYAIKTISTALAASILPITVLATTKNNGGVKRNGWFDFNFFIPTNELKPWSKLKPGDVLTSTLGKGQTYRLRIDYIDIGPILQQRPFLCPHGKDLRTTYCPACKNKFDSSSRLAGAWVRIEGGMG